MFYADILIVLVTRLNRWTDVYYIVNVSYLNANFLIKTCIKYMISPAGYNSRRAGVVVVVALAPVTVVAVVVVVAVILVDSLSLV